MITAVQRSIECVAREVAQLEADRIRFERLTEDLERRLLAMTAERDQAFRRLNELGSIRCAHPSCQLCQHEPVINVEPVQVTPSVR